MHTLFHIPPSLLAQQSTDQEIFEPIVQGPHGLLVERIISHGHTTPPGEWYDQDKDEWVMVLQGEATLEYANGSTVHLVQGMHVLLPAHCKHRVATTSTPCIWLAVHGQGLHSRCAEMPVPPLP
ncbi:cupin domain-containing protein [Desulfovibrio cuneatus]|uniref:cupin domain-containing protein n=1 Tax=Desulfovibrio cuneatus TaxID=159728 RepID=UPI0004158E45|nr:cupin domain-containing protein [Desulfovibrio cuneatus]